MDLLYNALGIYLGSHPTDGHYSTKIAAITPGEASVCGIVLDLATRDRSVRLTLEDNTGRILCYAKSDLLLFQYSFLYHCPIHIEGSVYTNDFGTNLRIKKVHAGDVSLIERLNRLRFSGTLWSTLLSDFQDGSAFTSLYSISHTLATDYLKALNSPIVLQTKKASAGWTEFIAPEIKMETPEVNQDQIRVLSNQVRASHRKLKGTCSSCPIVSYAYSDARTVAALDQISKGLSLLQRRMFVDLPFIKKIQKNNLTV